MIHSSNKKLKLKRLREMQVVVSELLARAYTKQNALAYSRLLEVQLDLDARVYTLAFGEGMSA